MKKYIIMIDNKCYAGESNETELQKPGLKHGFQGQSQQIQQKIFFSNIPIKIVGNINLKSHINKIFERNINFSNLTINVVK